MPSNIPDLKISGFTAWKKAIGAYGKLLLERADGMIYATSPSSDDRIVGNFSVCNQFGYTWEGIKWSRRFRKFEDVTHNVGKYTFAIVES